MKLSRSSKIAIASLLLGGGYGIALHAIAGELYDKAGYKEILSFQGEWIGMAILAIGLFLNVAWFWKLKIQT